MFFDSMPLIAWDTAAHKLTQVHLASWQSGGIVGGSIARLFAYATTPFVRRIGVANGANGTGENLVLVNRLGRSEVIGKKLDLNEIKKEIGWKNPFEISFELVDVDPAKPEFAGATKALTEAKEPVKNIMDEFTSRTAIRKLISNPEAAEKIIRLLTAKGNFNSQGACSDINVYSIDTGKYAGGYVVTHATSVDTGRGGHTSETAEFFRPDNVESKEYRDAKRAADANPGSYDAHERYEKARRDAKFVDTAWVNVGADRSYRKLTPRAFGL